MREHMVMALAMGSLGFATLGLAVAFGSPPRSRSQPRVYIDLDDVAVPFAMGAKWPDSTLFVDPGGVIWLRYDRGREGRVSVVQVVSTGPDGLARKPCVDVMPPVRGQGGVDYIRLEWPASSAGCSSQLVLLSENRGTMAFGVDATQGAPSPGQLEVGQRTAPVRAGDQDALVVLRAGETRTLHLGGAGGEALVVLPAGDYECAVARCSTGDAVLVDVDDRDDETVVSWLVERPGYLRLEHLRLSDQSCMIAHIYAAGRGGRGT